MVRDCRCLYDSLERIETSRLNLAEKRTSVDVFQRLRQLDLKNLWANSDRQLADSLSTKTKIARWRVLYNEKFLSAKKRPLTVLCISSFDKVEPSERPCSAFVSILDSALNML